MKRSCDPATIADCSDEVSDEDENSRRRQSRLSVQLFESLFIVGKNDFSSCVSDRQRAKRDRARAESAISN